MHDNEFVFFINNIRGHAFMKEPMVIKFDKVWYKLIPVDASKIDKFDNTCDSISVVSYNRKASKFDRFTVAYDDSGLKTAKYNDKYYIAQPDDIEERYD